MWDVLHGDSTKLLPEMARYGFRADCVITDAPDVILRALAAR